MMKDLWTFFDLEHENRYGGFEFRALERARKLAEALIDAEGNLEIKNLNELLAAMEQGWIYHPEGFSDGEIVEHQRATLLRFSEPWFALKLRQFQLPLCHAWAEKLVRQSLKEPETTKLTLPLLRKALLTACLTPLRQNVGSCFATAPAILIQREQLEVLVEDLFQLLSTGRLTRVIEGVEYGVPLSPSIRPRTFLPIGLQENPVMESKEQKFSSDPSANPLLKSWEFTLASFSEVKMEFAQWNLYTGLGLHHQEPGGIGEVIFGRVEKQVEGLNEKIQEMSEEIQIAHSQLQATEQLIKQAASEEQIRRLQMEHKTRSYHLRSCLEMRDHLHEEGSLKARLYTLFIEEFTRQFPDYFQEIYDAEMQEFTPELFEDSPAGFRLLYKHGRRDPSQWTLIYNADQYEQALVDFFAKVEPQIAALCPWKEGEKDVAAIISAIIQHVRTPAFIESALIRTERANRALPQREKGKNKPWAYISGGTLTTLVKTYTRRSAELTHEERWVESETELLIFIIDALKTAPPRATDRFRQNPRSGMLITSPTHAFILQPGYPLFFKGWHEEGFTYTWVRDEVVLPSLQFYTHMNFSREKQQFLFDAFCSSLPPVFAQRLRGAVHAAGGSIHEWRSSIVAQAREYADLLDAFLYQALPLVSPSEVPIYVRRLFSDKMDDALEKLLKHFVLPPAAFFTAAEVRAFAKELYVKAHPKRTYSFDLHQYVADHSRFIGLAQPSPLLFADTNWTESYFGFVVNPGTGTFELWRLDRTASSGMPMSSWKHWVNGTERKPWTIFVWPFEYI